MRVATAVTRAVHKDFLEYRVLAGITHIVVAAATLVKVIPGAWEWYV
jgi:hypothetical protein